MTFAPSSIRLLVRSGQRPLWRTRQHQPHQHHHHPSSQVPKRPNATNSKEPRTKDSKSQSYSPAQAHTEPHARPPTSEPHTQSAPAANQTSSTTATIPGPTWLWLQTLRTPFDSYSRYQSRRPWLVQLISTVLIYTFGDLSAQHLAPSEPVDHDYPRTFRTLIIGTLASIPNYTWFLYLSASFNIPNQFLLSLLTKVAVNQALFTPIFNTYFFGMQALLTGCNAREIWERVRDTVPTSWWNSCKLWPAVTAFSFWKVPLQFRAIFAGVIAVGWQTYLSMLNQKAEKAELGEKEEGESGRAATAVEASSAKAT